MRDEGRRGKGQDRPVLAARPVRAAGPGSRSPLLLPLLLLLSLLSHAVLPSLAQLQGLTLTTGALVPNFETSKTDYRVEVAYSTSTTLFTPTFSSGVTTFTYAICAGPFAEAYYTTSTNPPTPYPAQNTVSSAVTSGIAWPRSSPTPPHSLVPLMLNPGENTLTIVAGTRTYVVKIYRLSNDATISNLLCDRPLTPAFAHNVYHYRVNIAHTAATWSCEPTRGHLNPKVGESGKMEHSLNFGTYTTVANKAVASRPMATGDNRFDLKVTAEDPLYEQVYNIIVHKLSHDSTLSLLTPGSSSLVPGFASGTESYVVTLASGVGTITFSPFFAYTGKTPEPLYPATTPAAVPATTGQYKWNTLAVAPIVHGATTLPLTVAVGDNYFSMRVIAEDGDTTEYKVRVHRISNDVNLGSLRMNPGGSGFSPAFAPALRDYKVSLASNVESVTFQFVPLYPLSKVFYSVNTGPYSSSWTFDAPTLPIPTPVGETLVTVEVIAEDLVSTNTYKVTIKRLSGDATLKSMVTSIPLSPSFASNRWAYSMTVGVSTSSVRVTASPSYAAASMWTRINGHADGFVPLGAGVLSAAFGLVTGPNTLEVKVVSEDGVNTNITVISIHLQSSACSLLSLVTTPPGFGLDPSFDTARTERTYALRIPSSVESIQITATPSPLAVQQFQLGNEPLATFPPAVASPAGGIPMSYGLNTVHIQVMAEDGLSTKVYVLTVHRVWSVATIASMTSTVTLQPSFLPSRTEYEMDVASTVSSITLTPTLTNPLSTLTRSWQDEPFTPLTHPSQTLVPEGPTLGTTTIRFRVQAEDNSAHTVYTVTVHRISAVRTLSFLTTTPVGQGIEPVFGTALDNQYRLSQLASVGAIVLHPSLSYSRATWSWSKDGSAYSAALPASDTSSPSIPLDFGFTVLNVRVIAEDTVARTVYSLTVHRLSDESRIGAVAASVALSFDPNTFNYSLVTGQTVSSVSFTPRVLYARASLSWSFNGGAWVAGTSGAAFITPDLLTGDNEVRIAGKSEDGTLTSVYSFTIRRVSPTSTLAALSTNPMGLGLVPAFAPDVMEYKLTVVHAVSQLKVKSIFTYASSTQRILFNNVEIGTLGNGVESSALELLVGDQSVTLTILAEDQVSTSTYRLVVHRQSRDALLGSLVTSASLTPAFTPGRNEYNITVGYTVTVLLVTSTVGYPRSVQDMLQSGSTAWNPAGGGSSAQLSFPFSLPIGPSSIRIRVVSEDTAVTNVYTLSIHRQSNDATLNALTVTPPGTGLSPIFAPATRSYTLSVANAIASLTLTSSLSHTGATQQYAQGDAPYTVFASGSTTPPLDLAVGDNRISVRVVAENALTNAVYSLVVHRMSSTTTLSSLISSVALNPPFSPLTLQYAMNVSNSVERLTLLPTVTNSYSKLYCDPSLRGGGYELRTSGVAILTTDGKGIWLPVGDVLILIKVVAEDGTTNRVYSIAIHRVSNVVTLASLSVLPAGIGLVPAFESSSTTPYALDLLAGDSGVILIPTLSDPLASVAWSLNSAGYVPTISGAQSALIPVSFGSSQLLVRVTAEDKISRKIYTINVRRVSNVATLNTLFSSITLTPPFSSGEYSYSMRVAAAVSSVSFVPRTTSSVSSVAYALNDSPVMTPIVSSDSTGNLPLRTGANKVVFRVTSQDGYVVNTYTLEVYRLSNNASTFALNLDPPGSGLSPFFDPAKWNSTYTFTLGASSSALVITSTTRDKMAKQVWNIADGAWVGPPYGEVMVTEPIHIPFGDSVVGIKVTAEDGVTTRTTRIEIRRISDETAIPVLTSSQPLQPPYDPSLTEYASTIPAGVSSVTLSLTLASSLANAAWAQGDVVLSLVYTPLALSRVQKSNTASGTFTVTVPVGNSTLRVRSESEDTFQQRVYVFRLHRLSADTKLRSLVVPGLVPIFAPDVFRYSAVIPQSQSSITLAACMRYTPWATHSLRSTFQDFLLPLMACDETVTVPVGPGDQFLTISARAENGTVQEYVVKVRQVSDDASITDVLVPMILDGRGDPTLMSSLQPSFSPEVSTYHVNVSHALSFVRLRALANHAFATLSYRSTQWVFGAAQVSEPRVVANGTLWTVFVPSAGTTLITLTCTSEDTLVHSVVRIFIHRSPWAFVGLPVYFVSSARALVTLRPDFGNSTARAMQVRLISAPGATILTGVQSFDPSSGAPDASLVFVLEAPPSTQVLELTWAVVDSSFGVSGGVGGGGADANWDGWGYTAPLPIRVNILEGSWSSSMDPPYPLQRLFVDQMVQLSFTPSQPVAGTITVAMNWTLDGVPMESGLPVGSGPSFISFPPHSNVTQSFLARLPSSPGSLEASFTVQGFYPLPSSTWIVSPRAEFAFQGTPLPTGYGEMLVESAYSVLIGPSEAPELPGGVTLEARMYGGIGGQMGGGWEVLELHFAQGDASPKSLSFITPLLRANFSIQFLVRGPDQAHYLVPDPLHLSAADGCVSSTACGPRTIACVPQKGAEYFCVCEAGFTGPKCLDVMYTLPPSTTAPPPGAHPVPVLSGPSIIHPCDTLRLDGSRSFGMGALSGERKFRWRIVQAYPSTLSAPAAAASSLYLSETVELGPTSVRFRIQLKPASEELVTLASGSADVRDLSTIFIPGSQLVEGYTYVFGLAVGNSYQSSAPALLTVAVADSRLVWAPQVSIQAPPVLYPHVASTFSVTLLPSVCKELPWDVEYTFLWDVRVVGSSTNLVSTYPSAKTGVLQLPVGFFLPERTYTVSLSTRVTSGATNAGGFGSDVGSRRRMLQLPEVETQASASTLAVQALRSPLRVRIYGAMVRERSSNQPIVLDATDSGDPELEARPAAGTPAGGDATPSLHFQWNCTLGRRTLVFEAPDDECPFASGLPSMTSAVLLVPANSLPAGWYSFTLTASDLGFTRTAQALVEVEVVETSGAVVSVNLIDAPVFVEASSVVRLQGAAVTSSGTAPELLTYTWSSDPAIDIAGSRLSKEGSDVLLLRANTLSATVATQYTFTLTVCSVPDGGACSSASTLVALSAAPVDGGLVVTPASGIGLATQFTLRATGWVDPYAQDPLQYVFSYVDSSAAPADQQEMFLTAPSTAPSVSLMLPPGRLLIRLHVLNQQGAHALLEHDRYVLVQKHPDYSLSLQGYAENVTTALLPPMLARQNAAQSLNLLMQLSMLSNVITQRTKDLLRDAQELALALHEPLPSTADAMAADPGFAMRRKLWAALPQAVGWSVHAKTGAIVTSSEALDPLLAHQALQVVLTLSKHASPLTVAEPPSGLPSLLQLSAPMLNALLASMPSTLTGLSSSTIFGLRNSTGAPLPSTLLFSAGVLSRSQMLDMVFASITRATFNCSDLADARSLMLNLLVKEAEGAWPGEEGVHRNEAGSILAYSKRARTLSMMGPGDIEALLAAEEEEPALSELEEMLRSNTPRHAVGVSPTTPLYASLMSQLSATAPSSLTFDRAGAHPRWSAFVDRLSLTFASAAFENGTCRTGKTDYDRRLSVLASDDMAYSRLQWSHSRTTVPTTTNSSAPYMLEVQLPFNSDQLAYASTHSFELCGEEFEPGLKGPVVVPLSCALWSDVEQMYLPHRCTTDEITVNTTVVHCSCASFGEVGLVYMVDPAAFSPACEIMYGDTWLLIIASVYGACGIMLLAVGGFLVHWWPALAAKGQLGIALIVALYVAVVRAYLTLQMWFAPELDSVQVTVLQLLGFIVVHWVWLTAGFHWFRSLEALRTIHRRMHSASAFKPSWSRKPFLPLCLASLSLSICLFFLVMFVRSGHSIDLLYKTVLYAFAAIDFAFCIAALAAMLPATRDEGAAAEAEAEEDVIPQLKKHDDDADTAGSTLVRIEESSTSPKKAFPDKADASGAPAPATGGGDTTVAQADGSHAPDMHVEFSLASPSGVGPGADDGDDKSGRPAPPSHTASLERKGSLTAAGQSTPSTSARQGSSTKYEVLSKPSLASVRQARMYAARRSFAVVHSYLFMKVLPFMAACAFALMSILSFVATLADRELAYADSDAATLGLPFFALECFNVALAIALCFHSAFVSGLARRFPWPESQAAIEARQAAKLEAEAARAEAAQQKAHADAVAAAHAAAAEAAEAAARAAAAEAPSQKIAFEVAQAIFAHQQAIIASGGAAPLSPLSALGPLSPGGRPALPRSRSRNGGSSSSSSSSSSGSSSRSKRDANSTLTNPPNWTPDAAPEPPPALKLPSIRGLPSVSEESGGSRPSSGQGSARKLLPLHTDPASKLPPVSPVAQESESSTAVASSPLAPFMRKPLMVRGITLPPTSHSPNHAGGAGGSGEAGTTVQVQGKEGGEEAPNRDFGRGASGAPSSTEPLLHPRYDGSEAHILADLPVIPESENEDVGGSFPAPSPLDGVIASPSAVSRSGHFFDSAAATVGDHEFESDLPAEPLDATIPPTVTADASVDVGALPPSVEDVAAEKLPGEGQRWGAAVGWLADQPNATHTDVLRPGALAEHAVVEPPVEPDESKPYVEQPQVSPVSEEQPEPVAPQPDPVLEPMPGAVVDPVPAPAAVVSTEPASRPDSVVVEPIPVHVSVPLPLPEHEHVDRDRLRAETDMLRGALRNAPRKPAFTGTDEEPAEGATPAAAVAVPSALLPRTMTPPRTLPALPRMTGMLSSGAAFPAVPPTLPRPGVPMRVPMSLPKSMPVTMPAPATGSAPATPPATVSGSPPLRPHGSPRLSGVAGSVGSATLASSPRLRPGSGGPERLLEARTPPQTSPLLQARMDGPEGAAALVLDAPSSSTPVVPMGPRRQAAPIRLPMKVPKPPSRTPTPPAALPHQVNEDEVTAVAAAADEEWPEGDDERTGW